MTPSPRPDIVAQRYASHPSTARRAFGYTLPLLGWMLSREFAFPGSGDHRLGAWLIPLGFSLSVVCMMPERKKPRNKPSLIALIYGWIAFVGALVTGIICIVFNDWMKW
jgi:hypothetical protein